MQGFDNLRIETIYQLRHIGLEMGGRIAYSWIKWNLFIIKQANSVLQMLLRAAPPDNEPEKNVCSFSSVRYSKSVVNER